MDLYLCLDRRLSYAHRFVLCRVVRVSCFLSCVDCFVIVSWFILCCSVECLVELLALLFRVMLTWEVVCELVCDVSAAVDDNNKLAPDADADDDNNEAEPLAPLPLLALPLVLLPVLLLLLLALELELEPIAAVDDGVVACAAVLLVLLAVAPVAPVELMVVVVAVDDCTVVAVELETGPAYTQTNKSQHNKHQQQSSDTKREQMDTQGAVLHCCCEGPKAEQLRPPCAGAGCVHVRVCVPPPHDNEHDENAV